MIGPARLFAFLLVASIGLTGSSQRRPAPLPAGQPASPTWAAGSAAREALQSPVDSAVAELAVRRPWHSAQLLRGASGGGSSLQPQGRLVLARAETQAKSWERVRQLLDGAPWLDEVEGGEGWMLLGRAFEEMGRWQPAAEAYGRYLALAHARESAGTPAVVARRVRTLEHSGVGPESLELLASLRAREPTVASWIALEVARVAAARGDAAQVRALVASVPEPDLRDRVWDLEARALLAAGDSAAARPVIETAARTLGSEARRGEAWALLGDLLRLGGSPDAAREAYRSALGIAPAAASGRAARYLLEYGGLDAAQSLQVARALERVGDTERALRAYDLHASMTPVALPAGVRFARAGLMAELRERQDEAVREFTALQSDPQVGAGALTRWAELRELQGRSEDALTLRNRLMERFPASAEAANVLFLRGDAAHDAGNIDAALRDYRRLVDAAPSQDRAGLARMRWGQLHLHRGQPREAAEVFEGYLAQFPTGRRWEEATYWAAKARLDLGEGARARELISQLRAREPFGYYAILAGDLVGEPFRVDVPAGEEPPFPQWIVGGLATVDLLRSAGLREGAVTAVARLRARAADAPAAEALRLSLELTQRGYSLDGINVASELRARGEPLTRRLLEAMYPFPDRERVRREAREIGADPLLVAALIRQESAWEETIRSAVGATGLMQIMPQTGRELFDQLGLPDYDPEMLEVGDLNLHLGTTYLVDLLERYGGDLPLALSGYNAGPHRADRWRSFPEAADSLRFTERIPFAETRDYVKRIYRNRAIYRALYGPPSTE
jgi:soluble lytic murein transglycosylase